MNIAIAGAKNKVPALFFVAGKGVKTWQTNKAMVDIRRSGQLYGVGLLVWV